MAKKFAKKAVGLSRGGKNTKIHALVDVLGNPGAFLFSFGNDYDFFHAITFLEKVITSGNNVLGDKACNTKKTSDYISSQKSRYTIPPRENCSDLCSVD